MINFQTAAAALALAVAVAATATPALAKNSQRGHNARAQAIEVTDEGVSGARAKALRECSGRVAGFKGYNQMSIPVSIYRTCMTEHGEPE